MDKKFIVIFFTLILFFQLVSAATITINSKFSKGENLIAEVSGNFVSQINLNNILFYRRYIQTSMGFYNISKINGNYYIFTQIPSDKLTDNYSIVVRGVTYKNGENDISKDIVGNFSISGKVVPFKINPGMVITRGNYSINLINLEPNKIQIKYWQGNDGLVSGDLNILDGVSEKSVPASAKEINLLSGESVNINFEPERFDGFQKTYFNYKNETYSVLVYVPKGVFNLTQNKTTFKKNPILNETNKSNSGNLSFFEKIFGKSKNAKVEVNSSLNKTNNSSESGNGYVKTCKEMGYLVCNESERCEGNTTYGSAAKCCVGTCVQVKKSSTGKTIGWIIIIALAFFVAWFLKKKYQTTRTSPEKIFKKSK